MLCRDFLIPYSVCSLYCIYIHFQLLTCSIPPPPLSQQCTTSVLVCHKKSGWRCHGNEKKIAGGKTTAFSVPFQNVNKNIGIKAKKRISETERAMGDSSDQWHWWQHGEQIAKSTISWKQKERRRSAESKITAFSRNFNFSTKKYKNCSWLVSYWLSAWETRPEHPKDAKNKVKRPPSRIRGPILCKLVCDVESDKIETLAATGHLCLLCRDLVAKLLILTDKQQPLICVRRTRPISYTLTLTTVRESERAFVIRIYGFWDISWIRWIICRA